MKDYLKDKTLFWDFDGVILDSMLIRDQGFEVVLDQYPKSEVQALLGYHRKNGGLSRYVKFRYFFEEIRNEDVTEEEIYELAAQFSNVMLASLNDPNLLIEDSLEFIKKNHQNQVMNIVSGSDQEELRKLCAGLKIDTYFRAICGSPIPKTDLVMNLIREQGIDPLQAVLIGDSRNDYEAAIANEIAFMGYNNPDLKKLGIGYIEKFASR